MSAADEPTRAHRQPQENWRHGRLTVCRAEPAKPATRTGPVTVDDPAGERLGLAYGASTA